MITARSNEYDVFKEIMKTDHRPCVTETAFVQINDFGILVYSL